ncbi:hypothetical protein BH20ACT9_BH20ACT9_03750 [soil metagenome]
MASLTQRFPALAPGWRGDAVGHLPTDRSGMYASLRRLTFRMLWLFVFVVPVEGVLLIEGVGTLSRAAGLLAVAAAVAAVIVGGRRFPVGDTQLLILAFAAWALLSLFWTVDLESTFYSAFTMVQLAVMVLLVSEFGREPEPRRQLLWAYVLGAYVGSFGAVQAFLSGQPVGESGRYAAANANPGGFAQVLVLAIPIAWYLYLKSDRRLQGLVARGLIPVAMLAIILTASRSALIVLPVALSVIPLTFTRISAIHRLLAVLSLGVAAVVVAAVVPPTTVARLQTIPNELAEGDLSSRKQLWTASVDVFEESPWVGVGAGATRVAIQEDIGQRKGAHNTFLSIAGDLGIVGLALFGLILLSVYGRALTLDKPERYFVVVLLLTLTMFFLPSHRESDKTTWLTFAFAAGQVPVAADALRRPRDGLWLRMQRR